MIVSVTSTVSAAPNLNNETSVSESAQISVDEASVKPSGDEAVTHAEVNEAESPKVEERVIEPLAWQDNPNKCTDEQWIDKEPPFKCIDKPAQTKVVASTGLELSSSKEDLMRQAGIPEHEWAAVNEIISRESGWRHTIWNSTGSGAYGLCQSLPASKMASAGADYMTNPVTQLRWCNEYAKGYGGWINAASYSRCVGQCYSARVGAYVTKDHAWW